jgi:DNA polymerase-3 subunit alpha
LQPFQGGSCPIEIHYVSNVAKASLRLGDDWRVRPTDALLQQLKAFPDIISVELK